MVSNPWFLNVFWAIHELNETASGPINLLINGISIRFWSFLGFCYSHCSLQTVVSHQAFLCTRSCQKIRIGKNYMTQVVIALFTGACPWEEKKINIEGRKLSSIPQRKHGCASTDSFPDPKEWCCPFFFFPLLISCARIAHLFWVLAHGWFNGKRSQQLQQPSSLWKEFISLGTGMAVDPQNNLYWPGSLWEWGTCAGGGDV